MQILQRLPPMREWTSQSQGKTTKKPPNPAMKSASQNNAVPSYNCAGNSEKCVVWYHWSEICSKTLQIDLWMKGNLPPTKISSESGISIPSTATPSYIAQYLLQKMRWWRWLKLGLETWCGMMNVSSPNEAPQRKRRDSHSGTPSAKQHCYSVEQQE